jgi:hypothetical protein|tara:strand:- start:371 stop:505 length:135 start_codon:yes stop_codon:yes gene_type:complete
MTGKGSKPRKENSSKIRDRWPTNFSKRDKSQDRFTVKVNGKKVK